MLLDLIKFIIAFCKSSCYIIPLACFPELIWYIISLQDKKPHFIQAIALHYRQQHSFHAFWLKSFRCSQGCGGNETSKFLLSNSLEKLEGVMSTWTGQFCYSVNIYSVLLTTEVAATEVNRQNEINLLWALKNKYRNGLKKGLDNVWKRNALLI